jgi:glutathione S-transferase
VSVYTLYVIPGSHACRAAMLMLDHKRVPYRRVVAITGLHPVVARLHGFDAGGQTRTADGRRTLGLRIGDLLGTVPGLACGRERISTNHAIARFLDQRHPEPPLFPADPGQRTAVENVERWANDSLQMTARRVVGPAAARDPDGFSRSSADGRLGPLLYRHRIARRLLIPRLGLMFATNEAAEPAVLAELPSTLDRIDAWIADGVLAGSEVNAADCMIAPSLALMLYRADLAPMFAGRPALALVDRLLPAPV